MPGATPCSHWLALPARMTSTRLTRRRRPTGRQDRRRRRLYGNGQLKGTRHLSPWQGRRDPADHRQTTLIAATEASAQLRDRLLTEVHGAGSSDDAATWAHGKLADKNKLIAADAQAVENAFKAKLEALGVSGAHSSEAGARASATVSRAHPAQGTPKNRRRSRSIDKSVLAMADPRRVRDRDHVRLVAQQPCLVCGRRPADAHHLRFVQSRARSRKVSDEFTVPLCRGHPARCTAVATRPHGGGILAWTRLFRLAPRGWEAIRCGWIGKSRR